MKKAEATLASQAVVQYVAPAEKVEVDEIKSAFEIARAEGVEVEDFNFEEKTDNKWEYSPSLYGNTKWQVWRHKFNYGGTVTITNAKDREYFSVNFDEHYNNEVSILNMSTTKINAVENVLPVFDAIKIYKLIHSGIEEITEKYNGWFIAEKGEKDDTFNVTFRKCESAEKAKKAAFEVAEYVISALAAEFEKVDAAVLKHFENVQDDSTENGWEVVRDSAGIFDWTYYHKYPVEGFGEVEIKHPDNTEVYSVTLSNSLDNFISEVAKASDTFLFSLKVDGVIKNLNGEKTFCGTHYDATFSKGTEEENKAAAFAYADYLVEFLSHFEKNENGYTLNQEYLREYIYGKDSDETSETTEEAAEKNISTENKTDEKAANLPDNELKSNEGTKLPKCNDERLKTALNANQAKFEIGQYYYLKSFGSKTVYKVIGRRENKMSTSVTLQEHLYVDTEGNTHEMRGDIGNFKISVCLNSFEEIRLAKKKYLWALSVYQAATNEIPAEEKVENQIEPIKESFYAENKEDARALVENSQSSAENYNYRVEIEIENEGEPVKRETKYAKTFEDAISICKHTDAKLTTYHIEKIDKVGEWLAEVANDKFKVA